MHGKSPHRTRYAAERAFLDTFNQIASCVTPERVVLLDDPFRPVRGQLRFSGSGRARLNGEADLWLDIRHVFEASQVTGGWVVSSRAYHYQAYLGGQEIIAYHWHPGVTGFDAPHVHFKTLTNPVALRNAHFPTGRTSLEAIVRLLVRQLHVEPRPGWGRMLNRTEQHFAHARSWN